MTTISRLLSVALLSATTLLLLAAPALAHGRGSEATNFSSRVMDAPQLDGVTWQVHGGDQYLSVTNTGHSEVEVPGYQGEPYLRVGPDGVFANTASEAYYLNADRYAEVETIPEGVGHEEEPRWEQVSGGNTYAWHDHRIHWMSPALPPQVTDPAEPALITEWEVPFTYTGDQYKITGELRWVPSPSPLPWAAAGLVLTLPALLGLRAARGRDGDAPDGDAGSAWVRPMVRPAAIVLGVVSVLNIVHLIDDFAAVPLPVSAQITSALQTALFIALGLAGAIVASRGRDGAFTALGVGAAGIFVGQGLLYLDVMGVSQTASVAPDWFARLVIAMSLQQVLPNGIVAVVGNRRLAAEAPQPSADEQPAAAG